ncbi:MAG: hypothetical protein M3512_07575 [Bacteroidota bacterium]|nr:hypothetical protein [Bacteroidota bacterium]
MSELQRLESFRYALAVAETIEEINLIENAAAALAKFSRKEKISIDNKMK